MRPSNFFWMRDQRRDVFSIRPRVPSWTYCRSRYIFQCIRKVANIQHHSMKDGRLGLTHGQECKYMHMVCKCLLNTITLHAPYCITIGVQCIKNKLLITLTTVLVLFFSSQIAACKHLLSYDDVQKQCNIQSMS